MLKYLEYHKDTYTGYHTYAKSDECIQKYKHIMNNSLELTTRLSDTSVYTYRLEESNTYSAVGTSSEFFNCLKYCNSSPKKLCKVSLNTDITLINDDNYSNDFSNLNIQIRPANTVFMISKTVSNDNYIPTLELSNTAISCKNLDISGINLNVHDVSTGMISAITVYNLIMRGGSHQFYNNTSKNKKQNASGGAILTRGNCSFINTNIIFSKNASEAFGGAIYNYYTTITDSSITFRNNILLGSPTYKYGGGGGAIGSDGLLIISGSRTNLNFIDNSDLGNYTSGGGAIFVDNNITINTEGSGQIIFNGNCTNSNGGAIYSRGDTIIKDASITFSDNYSISGDGGAIYVDRSINFIDVSISFSNNYSISGDGGAIDASDNTIIKDSSIIFSNNSAEYGGAFNSKYIHITDTSITFSNNHANGNGGAINSERVTSISGSSITFSHNYGYYNGGAIYSTGDISFIDSNIIFRDNSSILADGGAIYSYSGDTNFIDSSITFHNNHAKYRDGGAIYAYIGNITFTDSSITFRDNYSISGDGGAIFHNSGEMIFAGGLYQFSNNHLLDQTKNGSVIGGDKILIDNSSQKTTLNFIDNSGKSTIWINNFDTSLACSDPSNKIPGCNNIYNFTHNLVNTGIFSFKDNLFMAGGSWDFSNNTYRNNKNTTALYGNVTTSKIYLRYADFSFDNTLVIVNASPDVSNIGKTKGKKATQEEKYYNYNIYHTSEFSGHAAIEISTNRYK